MAPTIPPTKAPTKMKINRVPAKRNAAEAPRKEEATFLKKDMIQGFVATKVPTLCRSTESF
jgi:hypothetical protein